MLIAPLLAVVLSASNPPAVTEAAWQPVEFAAGSFGTATIPPAALNGPCEYHPTLLGVGAYVRIFWKPPAAYPNLSDAEIDVHLIGNASAVTMLQGYPGASNTTVTASGNITDIPATLLGGILGFNTQFQVDIYTSTAGWKSTPVSVKANAGLVAGIGGSCTNIP